MLWYYFNKCMFTINILQLLQTLLDIFIFYKMKYESQKYGENV